MKVKLLCNILEEIANDFMSIEMLSELVNYITGMQMVLCCVDGDVNVDVVGVRKEILAVCKHLKKIDAISDERYKNISQYVSKKLK